MTNTPLVTVITASTACPYLPEAIESVKAQTYPNVQHLVVIDGPRKDSEAIVGRYEGIDVLQLPYATGADGYLGHRVYGSCTYLAKGDYLCFLDEDNWFDPDHIASLMSSIQEGKQWSYSLRKIVDKDGQYVCRDDCESLGQWPSVLGENDFLIDVGCYFLPRAVALQISPLWFRKAREPGVVEIDRIIAQVLKQHFPRFDTTGEYTLNYRAGNTERSVKKEFFLRGNHIMAQRYGDRLPWSKAAEQQA